MTQPISVVVPTRDRPEQLRACLTAVRRSLRAGDELIVVDSASRNEDVEAVARAAGASYARCEVPGASRARNHGAARAVHEIVVFVDDDVRVAPDWAEAMARGMGDAAVDFVTGRVSVPPSQAGYQRPVAVYEGDQPAVLDAGSERAPGPSANLAVRRSALDRVRGFDELLGAGARFQAAEDLDLYDRLFADGATGRYEPSALAWHEQWRDRRALLRLDLGYGIGSGARLAKLARTDRRRARHVVRTVLWRTDLCGLARAARRREEFAVLTTFVRLVGTVVGFVRGCATRVRCGHYTARERR